MIAWKIIILLVPGRWKYVHPVRKVNTDESVDCHEGHAEGWHADVGVEEEREEGACWPEAEYPFAVPESRIKKATIF